MLVLPDLDDIFVPIRDGLFADIQDSQSVFVNSLGPGADSRLDESSRTCSPR